MRDAVSVPPLGNPGSTLAGPLMEGPIMCLLPFQGCKAGYTAEKLSGWTDHKESVSLVQNSAGPEPSGAEHEVARSSIVLSSAPGEPWSRSALRAGVVGCTSCSMQSWPTHGWCWVGTVLSCLFSSLPCFCEGAHRAVSTGPQTKSKSFFPCLLPWRDK